MNKDKEPLMSENIITLDEAIKNSELKLNVLGQEEFVEFLPNGDIYVNGALTTDNNLIVETLKSIVKKQKS